MKFAFAVINASLLLGAMLGTSSVQGQNAAATPGTSTPDQQKIQQQAAELAREVREHSQDYNKAPHKKFISQSTKEPRYATYMQGWVAHIERIGNLNYPEQAREQHLHGEVIVTVGINCDGSLHSVDIIRGSGSAVLDDAAKDTVRRSAPFPPIPKNSHERVDILYITRTWRFEPAPSPPIG
jgi:periplasmic protein TonB